MKRSSPIRRALAALATVLALAACSDDSTDAEASAETASDSASSHQTTGETTSGAPIRITAIVDITSAGQSFEPAARAVEARIAAVNDAGGINGHPVELTVCDSRFDPNVAQACARDAVDNGSVAVLSAFTLQNDAVLPVLEAAGIPMLGIFLSNAQGTSPVSYPTSAGGIGSYATLGRWLAENGCERLGIVSSDVDAYLFYAELLRTSAEVHGAEVVDIVPVPLGAPDFAPAVQSLQADGADCLANVIGQAEVVRFVTAVQQSDTPDMLVAGAAAGYDGVDPGDLGDANLVVFGDMPMEDSDELVAEHDRFTPDAPQNQYYRVGWTAAWILTDALTRVEGDVTIDGLRSVLDSTPEFDPPTMEPISFAAELAVSGYERLFVTTGYGARLIDGGWVAIGPLDVRESLDEIAAGG